MHGISDKELVRRCIDGDRHAHKLLFDSYAGKMMTVCRRYAGKSIAAEDLLQEGFIRIFKNLHQFEFKGSLEGWIRRIMVHSSLKYITKKIHRIDHSELMENENVSVSASAFSALSAQDLMKLIQSLPAGYKTVFNLYALEGFTHAEIAEKLGIQTSTSRSQLVKARKLLQKKLEIIQKKVG